MKQAYSSAILAILLCLTACRGAPNIYQEYPVGVDTLTLGEVQKSPPQVVATLKGYTGVCERLETRQRLEAEAKTFYLSVAGIYEGPANAECPAIAQEYMQKVTLELSGLAPGIYVVRAGNQLASFALRQDEWEPYEASILDVEIALLESDPVQVVVTAEGHLHNGCDVLGEVNQHRVGDTFFVTVYGLTPDLPADFACTPAGANFSERIALQTTDLPPGTYKVDVNGVVESFTFP